MLRRVISTAIIGAGLLICAGCAAVIVGGAAAGGAGAVAYVRGELRATLDASLNHACKAVDRAAANLRLAPERAVEDGLESKRVFRTATGRPVTVKLNRLTDQTTAVAIRVGTFGDQSMSQQLLSEIQKTL